MAISRITDSVGRVLGDRYRLIRPVGTGASAHVYVAEDVDLRRQVAIKVLHPGLAQDEAFLRRFRAEAQAVAALRHPNILRVYDWGEDDGSPYLVMELLAGGSLRSLLDRGQLLSPAQAVAVGADAARALDYAHRRGLVHRDIKPANLIFDDEGRLSVADFGLARALAEATWTEPAGAVVGTARYAAPEQVRGQVLDSRADVYALALVLAEAMTGSVPFAADTTLGTLMARVEQPLRMPADFGPLGAVLEAAGTVDPAGRLDAAGLVAALEGVAAALPPPAALPLAGAFPADEVEVDSDPTDYPGRPRLFDVAAIDDAELLPAGSGHPHDPPSAAPAAFAGGRRGAGTSSGRPPPAPALPPDRIPPAPPRRRRRWPRRLAVLVVVLAVLAGGAAAALVESGRLTPSHPVPSLVGRDLAYSEAELRPLHLHLRVTARSYDARAAAGTVISQTPARGRLKEGKTVSVVLSLGPQPVPVPSLLRLTRDAAAAVLHTLGLDLGTVTPKASMTVPAGQVISSNPDSGTLLPGQKVAVVISSGKPTVAVPALSGAAGQSFAAAKADLAAAGLVAVETDRYSDTVPKGQVISTQPATGTTVTVGDQVTVVVSRGPHLAQIPSVRGDSVGTAAEVLAGDGFQVSGVTGSPIGTVTGTVPAAGVWVHYGSAVQIVTG